LSAGFVVFVNKVEHFRDAAETADAQYKKERDLTKELRAALDASNNNALSAAKDFNTRLDTIKKESGDKDVKIGELNASLAKLDQDNKVVEVALTNMTKVQEGQQAQLAAAQTQITELRAIRDKLVDERHTLNVQLTDALSKVDALDRALKNSNERVQAKQAMLDDLESKVKNAGFTLATLPKRSSEGVPVLEGVVSQVFSAGGRPWATISIGSKENVEKGMKFNVVSNNEFLGYLTIQTTEPNEAAGVLDGPKVDKVRSGNQAKTQLQ